MMIRYFRPFAAATLNHGQRRWLSGMTSGVKKVGVVGMGLMGHGIAQIAAIENFQVVACDKDQGMLEKASQAIGDSLTKMKVENVEEVLSRIYMTSDIAAVSDADIVVEAIIENLDIKREFYKNLGKLCSDTTILASNTSSFPIGELAVASGRPEKFVGLHFFNPVQLMKLVEVVRTDKTDDAIFQSAFNFAKELKRTPVACKDTPGFIVNRLLVPYLAQAMAMVDRADASVEDIDTAMKLGAGHPMGPLQLADYVGLDTIQSILQGWMKMHPDNPDFFEPDCLTKLVSENKLGRKSGQGFYKWDGNKIAK